MLINVHSPNSISLHKHRLIQLSSRDILHIMSDNISPEEIKKQLVLFLSIPAEVWTDVLKLFSRRILVKNISPVCYRLKEICDKNVKSIHVIENADQFTDKLKEDNPEANNQLENLAANKCKLAGQFRLTKLRISNEKSQHVLRHSLNLLQGCQLSFNTNWHSATDDMASLGECLTILESTKPVTIQIGQREVREPDGTFWLHPTVQKCGRILLKIWSDSSDALMRTYLAIFHWLHHQPMDCNRFVADQQVRCMIVWFADPYHLDWLLDLCSQNIQQAKEPIDRRPFVLSFDCYNSDWSGGQFRRIENKSTGEVLVLDRVIDEEDGESIDEFRLRRCLADEEASGPMFYAEMFKHDNEYDDFNIGKEATAKVRIG